jgi:hypothetical protein
MQEAAARTRRPTPGDVAKLEKLEIVDDLPWPPRDAASGDGSVRYERRTARSASKTEQPGLQRETVNAKSA